MPTVLVVDDEPAIRGLLRAVLERHGYRPLEATDGAAALDRARRERPDLVLLDIALPRLSGLEVCRRLKGHPATAQIPVLLVTGFAQQAERQAAKEAGADGFVAKPFSPAALLGQIDDALSERIAAGGR